MWKCLSACSSIRVIYPIRASPCSGINDHHPISPPLFRVFILTFSPTPSSPLLSISDSSTSPNVLPVRVEARIKIARDRAINYVPCSRRVVQGLTVSVWFLITFHTSPYIHVPLLSLLSVSPCLFQFVIARRRHLSPMPRPSRTALGLEMSEAWTTSR
jgi:hypothetical protein